MYDANTDYYYLFVSYGTLTSNGGYQIRVFRSKTVDGEYVDMNGEYPQKSAMHENYGLKLSGNYKLPSLDRAYMDTTTLLLQIATERSIWFTTLVSTTVERITLQEYIRCL